MGTAPILDETADWYQDYKIPDDDDVIFDVGTAESRPTTPSEFTEFAVYLPQGGEMLPFNFRDRRYLRLIYDTKAQRKLIVAGRQVEKSQVLDSIVSLADGRLVEAREIKVGQRVSCLEMPGGAKSTSGKVVWVSKVYTKPCIRVRTRQGHTADIALTHPVRTWNTWTEGGDLKVGDRVAAVRQAGEFGEEDQPRARIALTAYAIADGGLGGKRVTVTKSAGPVQNELLALLEEIGAKATESRDKRRAPTFYVSAGSQLHAWLEEDELRGCLSPEKFVPDWVFALSRENTALFINRLWSCDGHVKQNNPSKYSIEYSSTSYTLIRQVQALLWKFGVPSSIRHYQPKVYRGTDKWHHILRVETQGGVETFLQEIGALGKSEEVPLPSVPSSNNRDTIPKGITEDIRRIVRSGGDDWKSKRQSSLYAAGLRLSPKYSLTFEKLQHYVDFFRNDNRYDQFLVDDLEKHLDTDIFWDEIESIEDIGEQECIDFSVETHNNFVMDGLFTHNSTLLGNMALAYCSLIPSFRVLYVSPSHQQTKVFSRDRIKEPMEVSPILSKFTNSKLLSNVLERKLINRSQITLRFAFLNADRTRGIPADLVDIDEFQDVLLDNVPVIEECASHSEYKFFNYSGTPKSLDGSLEHYWQKFSTQNEWVVPCRRHGTPKDPSSWHWNILREDNIGPDGLICDKCGGLIDAKDPDAQWASLNPKPRVEKPFEGYRIPQLMVPWIDWSDILDKQRKYSRAKFYNEVLGRSYDSGTRPLTRQDMIENCNQQLTMRAYRKVATDYASQYPVFMGTDWGSGESSYTVVVLGGYMPWDPDKFTFFYMHRFEGIESEPKFQIKRIMELVDEFQVKVIGVDYGGGFWPNDDLLRNYGAEKVKKYQWVGNVRQKIKYDSQLFRFLCHRTEVMSDIFNAIKRRDVFRFPKWEEFEDPFAMDFLNIFSEYNERLRMNIYKNSPGNPDDTCHAAIYCFLASMFHKKRPDIILPRKEIEREHYDEREELDVC